jgi:hypothetical protein
MQKQSASRLFYFGTNDEVRLGDRVIVKGWFGRQRRGTVCYIPGISPKHKEMEYDDIKSWAIRLEDGTVLSIGYYPENKYCQPKKTFGATVAAYGRRFET